jgi:double-stranded uracil-DNA glycosylase
VSRGTKASGNSRARPRGSARDEVGPGQPALCEGFPPIATPETRLLILGSMPSERSLAAAQYYAHPHNLFWPFLGELLGFRPDAPYPERTAHLLAAGIALWDVVRCCRRTGSLDAAIEPASIVVNDFARFFPAHPHLERICCNGTAAFALFTRHVLPTLPAAPTTTPPLRLPSTSPANASQRRADKLAAWRSALATVLPPTD